MSDEKEVGIEEICLGHLSTGDNMEMLKERLTLSFSLRKETNETLQEFLDRMMPKDNIYACIAETMLLALEERFVNYSLGDNINLNQLEEIADIAAHYGFKVQLPGT